jgi:hypothetical protein
MVNTRVKVKMNDHQTAKINPKMIRIILTGACWIYLIVADEAQWIPAKALIKSFVNEKQTTSNSQWLMVFLSRFLQKVFGNYPE